MLAAVLALAVAASPTPSPTTASRCYRDVTLVTAVDPGYPESAKDLGIAFDEVVVQVDVNADGTVSEAHIYKSGHIMALDAAALRAARTSTYAPKVIACAAVAGVYMFIADFRQ